MPDHVMEPAPRGSPSIASASPRRHSVEDANPSLTRKRPRLDSGSRARRSMSADANASPVEVTLNLRPQLPSPQSSPSPQHTMASPDPASPARAPAEAPTAPALGVPAPGVDDSPPIGSPVIEVDVDDDSVDSMDGVLAPSVVQLEGDEISLEEYLTQFPYADSHYHPAEALRLIASHVQGAQPVDGAILKAVTTWLGSFPCHAAMSPTSFVTHASFWEELANLAYKVLARRVSFGDDFGLPSSAGDALILRFLGSYLKVCAYLLHVDGELLPSWPATVSANAVLLSFKHLRSLSLVLRPERSPVFELMHREYHTDLSLHCSRLVSDFVQAPAYGAQHLLRFAELAWEKLAGTPRIGLAHQACHLLEQLGWSLMELVHVPSTVDRADFVCGSHGVFQQYDHELQTPDKIPDAGASKDLLLACATLLQGIVTWDRLTGAPLAREHRTTHPASSVLALDAPEHMDGMPSKLQEAAYFPALVAKIWKFKLLKKYVLKGRMELRVMSIGVMDATLVEVWRDYHVSDAGALHPMLQYLAGFLIKERIIEYILSADSHPQLISRSGNIVGFLVVTHRYSERQTDAIWHTVSNSPDPRVVSATLSMLRTIVSLMEPPELQYLCRKFYLLPIESYSLETLRFLREVSFRFQQKGKDWQLEDSDARPASVCVRVMQDTSPSRTSSKLASQLHSEASEQLRMLSPSVGTEERRHMFQACLPDISNKTAKATGSVHALYVLCYHAGYDDAHFLAGDLGLTRHLVDELCAVVRAEGTQEPHAVQTTAMQHRLDLLAHIIAWVPDALPDDQYEDLWEHLIGAHALNNAMRDLAWSRFIDCVRVRSHAPFCNRLLSTHIPKLQPAFYTSGLYDFVAHLTLPMTKRLVGHDGESGRLLDVPGSDYLWPLVLKAPDGTIEELAAKQLANRYLDILYVRDVTIDEVEEAHVALVEQCTQTLLASYSALRSEAPEQADASAQALRFTRTLLFEKLLLQDIRTRPEFVRPRTETARKPLEPPVVEGDPMEIRFQAFTGNPRPPRQTLPMGSENTFQQLYDQICGRVGLSKLVFIIGGARRYLSDHSSKTLAEFGDAITWILVSKDPSATTMESANDGDRDCSVFEKQVLGHFEGLYACMDSEDHISEAVRHFQSSRQQLTHADVRLSLLLSASPADCERCDSWRCFRRRHLSARQSLSSQVRCSDAPRAAAPAAWQSNHLHPA